MNSIKVALTAAFGALIFVPFVGHYAYKGSNSTQILKTENRRVAPYRELQSFRKKSVKEYFSNLDRYISDRLLKKDSVVKRVNRILANPVFFTTVDYSKGVIGKEGFLFLGNHYDKVITRHFLDPDSDTLNNNQRLLSLHKRLSETVRSAGADYFLFVAPDKHAVYCEKFPDWLNPHSCRDARKTTGRILEKLAGAGVQAVYPYEALRARREESVYYKTDTHWNNLGAEIGFRSLLDAIRERGGAFSQKPFSRHTDYTLRKAPNTQLGDLGAIIGLDKHFRFEDIRYELSAPGTILWSDRGGAFSEVPNASARGADPKWFGQMKNPSSPNRQRVVVFCDSFMTAMSLQFNKNFPDIYYSSRHRPVEQLEKIVKEFQPDLVVYETVERALQ